MGRGGGSSERKKQGRAKSSAAAAEDERAEPAPPAPGAIPHEPAWRLLLGEVWQAPDAQLVCRLLCCSTAMARLVHAACAGRVVASVSRQPHSYGYGYANQEWQQQMTAQGKAYSTWLAKHARLLADLRLEVWVEQEAHVAAGLRGAAGVPQRTTRSSTAVARAAAAAAAAAAAGNDKEEAGAAAQPLPLPLRSLVLSSARTSDSESIRLLPGLAAACPQLTQLQLAAVSGPLLAQGQEQQLATAFTALRGLRELSLDAHCFSAMAAPELQLGSQLTKLRLHYVKLSAQAFSSLPPSLADLEHWCDAALPAAGHLTALTRLSCGTLDAGSNVPPSVEELQVNYCRDPAPLHHLTRLRSLCCDVMDCSLEQLQAAVAAIGPSLTALDVRAEGGLGPALLSQCVSGPSLPLTGLTVGDDQSVSVAHLGQWTGLTRLSLADAVVEESPQQLAQQLQQLTRLQELELVVLRFLGRPPPSLQPLVDGLVGMSSLRSLRMYSCGLDAQQRAQLQGATQLTYLSVS